jgi:hypothetical protein
MIKNGNKNIHHINCIEGLLSEVNTHIEAIQPGYARQTIAKEQALKEVNDLQTGILHSLRILFEGD